MFNAPTNSDRAGWAREAVDVFGARTFSGSTFSGEIGDQPDEHGDPACMVSDLIANLLHLAREQGWDPEKIHANALEVFLEEVAEETYEDNTGEAA